MSVQESQAPATSEAEDKTPETQASTEPLGDAGKRALDAERKARRDADRRAAQLETKLKEYEDAQKSDAEKLSDKLAEETKLREETEQRLKDSEIRLAVLENAGEGDPARLLKHTDFLAAIANVDPDDTDAARKVNPDIICLCHGGPIAEPEDAQYILDNTEGIVGFFGASSVERLPTEKAIKKQVEDFKSMKFKA